MEEELMKSLRFRQADNSHTKITPQTASQSMTAQTTQQASIFAGNDAKRMSFDGQLPQYNLSSSPGSLGFTAGLIGSNPQTFNRERRDSLKLLAHLQDFGTD